MCVFFFSNKYDHFPLLSQNFYVYSFHEPKAILSIFKYVDLTNVCMLPISSLKFENAYV